jgi:hypothetical protein
LTADLPNYEEQFKKCVEDFWLVRASQAAKQVDAGKADAGTRGAVTGGKHLHSFAALIQQVFADAGMPIRKGSESTLLPGYYRASKNWDTVVTYKGRVVAIIELKSQVGSFGNNQNNRIEEMIGQSLDIWRATRESLLGDLRPWFAYLMLLEDTAGSRTLVKGRTNPSFRQDNVFTGTNYLDRYKIAFERLRLEGDMNAACLLISDPHRSTVEYPDPTMTFNAFAAAIHGRVTEVLGLLGADDEATLL